MSNLVLQIETKSSNIFARLGFEPTHVNSEKVYKNEGGYHKFSFVDGLGAFVIEWAASLDEASKNMYEDCDLLPISLGENELLHQLEDILVEHYSK